MSALKVFREYEGVYERVGELDLQSDRTLFTYDEGYATRPDAVAISHSLELGKPGGQVTRFFEGLLPEEGMREAYDQALHASAQTADGLLASLNDESVGALVFGESEEQLNSDRGYEPLDVDLLSEFARRPRAIALKMGMASRLSLAGAQAKMGLRFLDGGWYAPRGSAPSTHIVKASDGSFPDLAINELICLETAHQMGFETARAFLIPVDGMEPLLAVERFDRVSTDAFPRRVHQEDFSQALGFPASYRFKYEPTGGNYLQLCETLINQVTDNPFGERMLFFQEMLFDYCIGNTDNHLKNHSFLWSGDWQRRELSPLYDVTCCTIYSQLDREMGVSLCPSRRIDDVTRDSILDTANDANIPTAMADRLIDEVRGGFLPALHAAVDYLADNYEMHAALCERIRKVAKEIEKDSLSRVS